MLRMDLTWEKDYVVLPQTGLIESMAKKYLGNGDNGRKCSLPLAEKQDYQKPNENDETPDY